MESFAFTHRPERLGTITHGSLSKGVEMKLDPSVSVEALRAGQFVVIEGEQYDFFSMITDIALGASNEQILLHPPDEEEHLLRQILQGASTFATVTLRPMLMMENRNLEEFVEPRKVKTVPVHFAPVARATEEDVARIFGHEANDGGKRYFEIGRPLDMDTPVCIDLNRFVERSNGIFGKTGTGKTFITRLILAGLIKTQKAVNLIFDMHSEYGLSSRKESDDGRAHFVKGLRDLFPSRVAIFSLDPPTTRMRKINPDHEVYLYADQIEPEDILPLQDTLSLNPTATETTYLLKNRFGNQWLLRLLQASGEEIKALAETLGAHESSLSALARKLKQLEKFSFFKTESSRGKEDVLEALLEHIDRGRSVIIEFGRYDDLLAYLLVANMITRRIRTAYERKTNQYLASQNEADRPPQLMITIEEAHKFLTSPVARETPFGKIAREMRKFFVSLLIVDQRPSAIDEEVLSQIGTRLVAQLSDEKDIQAVLVGTPNASAMRQVLASLDSKQQTLVMGHAVPMPVVVRTRNYDETFYQAMTGSDEAMASPSQKKASIQSLFAGD